MMGVLYAGILFLIFLIVTLTNKKICKTIYTPLTIFNFIWCIFSGLACTGVYGLYQPGVETIILFIIAIIFFNIAYYLALSSERGELCTFFKFVSDELYKDKILFILNLIAFFISLTVLVKSVPVLLTSGFVQLRYYYLNTSTLGYLMTTRQALVLQWIVFPVYTVNQVLCAIAIIQRKKNILLYIYTVIGIANIVLISGGRSAVFKFVIFTFIAYFLTTGKKQIKLDMKQKVMLAAAVAIMIYITSIRSIGDSTILQNVAYYFLGPTVYFDNIVKNPELFGLDNIMWFGKATFGFITTVVEIVFSIITGSDYQGVDNILSKYSEIYYNFSDTAKGNHVYTMLYPFMLDWGYLGVPLGSFIIGFSTGFLYKKALQTGKNQFMWQCILVYFAFGIFYSQFEYRFLYPATFTTLVYILIITGHYKIKIRKQLTG